MRDDKNEMAEKIEREKKMVNTNLIAMTERERLEENHCFLF